MYRLHYRFALFACVCLAALATSAPAAVIRVKWDSPVNGPGGDWSNAYQTVAAAIAASAAGDEIWVAGDAAHPYVENITLKDGVGLYGGFAGGETTRDQRDWKTNVTILHGRGSGTVVRPPSGATATTVLDGFTIRNGWDGIYCSSSSPTITNNTVSGNSSRGISCSYDSSPAITNNTISGNGEAGILCDYSSSPTITNNTISGNGWAGISCDDSSPTITNNTIAGSGQYGIYCDSSSPTITNNIVAFNATGIRKVYDTASPVLRNNCVYNPDGANYSNLSAGTGDISADPEFQSAAYGRLHIQPDSPCVDVGLDSVVGAGWKDMDGQARILGSHVDIGADESDGTVWPEYDPVIVRVSPDGVDDAAHDGSSWPLAKRTVQAGILAASAAGGEVWVAAGVYNERIRLPVHVYLYGGFAGGESSRDERDWGVNSTVLDGGGSTVVTAAGGHRLSGIDGFTIRNGEYGIYCDRYSSPSIANNTITGGGSYGIYCNYSSPSITNNTVSGNSSRGISCSYDSSPAITNNTISGNGEAGILCDYSSSPTITNNTISGNGWAGISCDDSSPTITNNIVTFNGTGIRNSGGTPVLGSNCVFNPDGTDYDGLSAGTGDIAVNPKLQAAAYGWLHIQPDSPCVDAGLDSVVGAGGTDMDGQARIQGSHVDIGADESDGTVWPEYDPVIVRVSPDGVDDAAHDGSSWPLAKRTVQAGIEAASAGGGDVWVEAGVYNERIRLPAYVYLYGGFAGAESSRDERDWGVNSTVLDGGGNDYVVTARRGYRVSGIDGFTIRNGGHGIDCSSSSPSITNNAIAGNGYGIFCRGYTAPSITNNTITRNRAAGVYCAGASAPITNNTITGNGNGIMCLFSSSPAVTNNAISGNYVSGIFCDESLPVITNNTISGNGGNGIVCSRSSPAITNNTISGNGIHGISCASSSSAITNNIISFNVTGISNGSGGTPVLRNNCVYNPNGKNYGNLSAGTGDINADPGFQSGAYGRLHIQPDSPCVDAGLDDAVEPVWKDVDGQARIQGAHVDIGADETDGTVWPDHVPVIVRVSPGGDDDNDGGSWTLAKRTVQAGIDAASAAGGEVWVAAGTYTEHVILLSYARVYGGFSGTESALDERHWGPNVVVLDGGGTGDVVTARGSFGVSGLDGFTVRNGGNYGISCNYASPALTNNTIAGNGYGIYCSNSSPAITNNTIARNVYGIYCYASAAPVLTNNIVVHNATGICRSGTSSTPVLRNNCVFNPDGTSYSGLSAGTDDISADPKLQPAAYGRLHIRPDSPCVDAGLDAAVEPSWKDMDGQARIQGLRVDIGADETDGTVWPEYVPVIVRVSPGGDDDNDGGSWGRAKRTVQAGIDEASAAGGEVWVAAGTYTEHVKLLPYAWVYGGFSGSETAPGVRNSAANRTVLAGGGTGDVVSARGGWRVSGLDGFAVRNGDRGIYCSNSGPALTNNTITENASYGIYCDHSSPAITNNTITGSNSTGVCCYTDSLPTITNNIIAFNATGIHRYDSYNSPVLRNNCVYNPGMGRDYSNLSAGTGDISADPLFVDRAARDLRLLPGSPCIDAGYDTGIPSWLLVDLDGNPRISGAHVDIGAYEFQHPATSIPNARGGKDGAPVSLIGVIVTAAWPDVLYVEQPDRACGIRVEKAGHGLAVGQSATVEGVMGTTTDGERMINATSASGSAGQALPALGMTSRSLGGADSAGYSAADGTGQQGVTGGTGLNNIGLLVRVAGRVTFVDPGGQFFTLWDGSVVEDADGHDGVRVSAPGLTLPALDEFATVTGISSCYKSGADLYPRVLARTAGDIVTQVF